MATATAHEPMTIDAVADQADWIIAAPDEALAASAPELADELLAMGEVVLERWLIAHDREPTDRKVEGFRLLGLESLPFASSGAFAHTSQL